MFDLISVKAVGNERSMVCQGICYQVPDIILLNLLSNAADSEGVGRPSAEEGAQEEA